MPTFVIGIILFSITEKIVQDDLGVTGDPTLSWDKGCTLSIRINKKRTQQGEKDKET